MPLVSGSVYLSSLCLNVEIVKKLFEGSSFHIGHLGILFERAEGRMIMYDNIILEWTMSTAIYSLFNVFLRNTLSRLFVERVTLS